MASHNPIRDLRTHEVTNQPPPLEDYNLFDTDTVLREALTREGADWAEPRVHAFGAELGRAETIRQGELANRYKPELRVFDRFGQRIDEVEFHSAYHHMMALGISHGMPTIAWTADRTGGHVAHTAMEYMAFQIEAGHCCPLTMTYAAVPALRAEPAVAAEWEPRILSGVYDPSSRPASDKAGATIGMAMTEKQGGSDVRANTTRAVPAGGDGVYSLTGHKWFCSAPMSDAFLTLAYAEGGLSCFLVPRWRPDGSRNAFRIQRLKDKLGNHANASSEIEYEDTWARRIGAEGEGVKTIIEMVHHTRLDTTLAAAALMRQALIQAIHHARHRVAFQRRLVDQPLMRNVLADLAVESEAATTLTMRVARSYDQGMDGTAERAFARLAVAVAKYWINKRTPNHIYECMECLGGAGYVEESPLPRLYREGPLNSIWEGSGNVICLDVLRTMQREPAAQEALMHELQLSAGADRRYDAELKVMGDKLRRGDDMEHRARRIVEHLALMLQAGLLLRYAPHSVADAFIASRLVLDSGHAYGTLPSGTDTAAIVDRAWQPVS